MDEETAKLAVEKMQKITNKIGYPDKWKSYGKVYYLYFELFIIVFFLILFFFFAYFFLFYFFIFLFFFFFS